MTIVLTISCPEGIVMAADRKISRITNNRIQDIGSRDKLVVFRQHGISISYWGLATLGGIEMRKHLLAVKSQILDSGMTLDVDTYAGQLRDYIQQYTPSSRMGFHVAGYMEDTPKIRHVFHVDWHPPNGFTNEESNVMFHDNQGRSVPHTPSYDYIPYISLFNGDNTIVQSLLLTIPAFRGLSHALDYGTLTLNETISLAKLLVSTTIYLQKFLRGYRRVGRTCGNGLDIVKITSSEIDWVVRNLGTVSLNVQ